MIDVYSGIRYEVVTADGSRTFKDNDEGLKALAAHRADLRRDAVPYTLFERRWIETRTPIGEIRT